MDRTRPATQKPRRRRLQSSQKRPVIIMTPKVLDSVLMPPPPPPPLLPLSPGPSSPPPPEEIQPTPDTSKCISVCITPAQLMNSPLIEFLDMRMKLLGRAKKVVVPPENIIDLTLEDGDDDDDDKENHASKIEPITSSPGLQKKRKKSKGVQC